MSTLYIALGTVSAAVITGFSTWRIAAWKNERDRENMTLQDAYNLYRDKQRAAAEHGNATLLEEVRQQNAKDLFSHSRLIEREFDKIEKVFIETIDAADAAMALFGLRLGGINWNQLRDPSAFEAKLDEYNITPDDKAQILARIQRSPAGAAKMAQAALRMQELRDVDEKRVAAHNAYAHAQLFLPDSVLCVASDLYSSIFSLWYSVREQVFNEFELGKGNRYALQERTRIAQEIGSARRTVTEKRLEFVRACRTSLGKKPDPVKEVVDPNRADETDMALQVNEEASVQDFEESTPTPSS